jgi:hypothetical protein
MLDADAGRIAKQPMLQKLADHIAGCLARAIDFERRASEASEPEVRRSCEEIAKPWRHVAASYQCAESLDLVATERAR